MLLRSPLAWLAVVAAAAALLTTAGVRPAVGADGSRHAAESRHGGADAEARCRRGPVAARGGLGLPSRTQDAGRVLRITRDGGAARTRPLGTIGSAPRWS